MLSGFHWKFSERTPFKQFFKICLLTSHGACLLAFQFLLNFHPSPVSCVAEPGGERALLSTHASDLVFGFPFERGTGMVQSQTQCKIVNRISKPAPGPSSFMVQVKMQGQSEGERLAKVLCLGDCWQMSFGSSSHHQTLLPPFCTCPDKTPPGSLSFHSENFSFFFFFALFYQTQLYIRFVRRDD